MKHRMYERILYDTYTKLNKGLDSLQDVIGYGCPLGMQPITYEELEHDRQSAPYGYDGYRKIISVENLDLEEKPSILRFLKRGGEAYRILAAKERKQKALLFKLEDYVRTH